MRLVMKANGVPKHWEGVVDRSGGDGFPCGEAFAVFKRADFPAQDDLKVVEDIIEMLGWWNYYSGPGGYFEGMPGGWCQGSRVLISKSYGYDV